MTAPDFLCPRCGYDLTGLIAGWKDHCPLRGKCSECGHDFSWGDLLDPGRKIPWWSFEHARRRIVRAWVSTLARTLVPWRFWTLIRLEFPFRPARLAVLVAAAALAMHAGYNAVYMLYRAILGVPPVGGKRASPFFSIEDVFYMLWPRTLLGEASLYISPNYWYMSSGKTPAVTWCVLAAWAITPATFALLPETLGAAKVRARHLIRAAGYELPALLTLATLPYMTPDLLTVSQTLAVAFGTSIPFTTTVPIELAMETYGWRTTGLLMVAWHAWWWHWACKRYLLLPRPTSVALAMCLVAILAALVVIVLSGPIGLRLMDHLQL